MKSVHWLVSLAFLLLCLGCGASTSSTIPFHQESFQGDSDAVVYVYREPSFVGAAASWPVRIDDQVVGDLKQNAYMALHVAPGVHTIKIGDDGPLIAGAIVEAVVDNPGAFRAKPKEKYYIRSKGFEVAFLTEQQAMDGLKTMKYDMGR